MFRDFYLIAVKVVVKACACGLLIYFFQVTHFVILDDRADAADAELLPHFIQVRCPNW